MSVPALLKGCTEALQTALGETFVCGERPLDGAPWAAYKTGKGWYVGVYFGGAQAIGGESYRVSYTLGVDLTRVAPTIRTADKGKWFLQDGELFAVAGRISQFFLTGRGIIQTACNAALAGQWEEGKGCFREQFHSGNMGKALDKGPEWIAAVPGERQPGAIIALPMTFSGLQWWQLLSETWQGGTE